MGQLSIAATLFVLLAAWALPPATAQKLKEIDPQFHGYVTQSLIYSNQNNWDTTNSTDGSLAWTEAVANATARPASRLRVGAQARYFRLGTSGNSVTLDWASAELKVNEYFGFRAGKVKTPDGLLNDSQDVDPAHLWILLPQSIYPVASRGASLAHYGGVVFGTIPLGERLDKLEYRAFGGERSIPSGDGYLDRLRTGGFTVPDGLKGRTYGGALHWRTPIPGLMIGASTSFEKLHGPIGLGPYKGTLATAPFHLSKYFARYEHARFMFAGEYYPYSATSSIQISPLPLIASAASYQNFYAMASYKLSSKLTGGLYYSSDINHVAAFTSDRYQKDWTLSARYDFNSYLYLKAEQHFLDGTSIGYSASNNKNGLAETSRLSFLKLGVSF